MGNHMAMNTHAGKAGTPLCGTLSGLLLATGLAKGCSAGLPILCYIRDRTAVKVTKHFNGALFVALMVVICPFLVTYGIIGCYQYGQKTEDSILENMGRELSGTPIPIVIPVSSAVNILLALKCLSVYPSLLKVMCQSCNVLTRSDEARFALWIVLNVIITLLAVGCSDLLAKLMALIGIFMTCVTSLIVPMLCFVFICPSVGLKIKLQKALAIVLACVAWVYACGGTAMLLSRSV